MSILTYARPSPVQWRNQAWCSQSLLRVKVLRPKIKSRGIRRPGGPIIDVVRRTADLPSQRKQNQSG